MVRGDGHGSVPVFLFGLRLPAPKQADCIPGFLSSSLECNRGQRERPIQNHWEMHHALGYRRVFGPICLFGATLTSVPQIFVNSYWLFVAERFAVGLFIGGILPTANALIGHGVARESRGTIYGMTASATFMGNSLGSTHRGPHRGGPRHQMGVRDDRDTADGQSGLGLSSGPEHTEGPGDS